MSKKHRVKARAVAGSQEWGYASTGTEQVGIRITLIEGDWSGQSVTWYGFLTDNSEARTLEQLEIAGWDKSSVIDLPGLGSTEFELELEEETDEQGNTYMRPTWINRIGVAMKKKMDDNAKRALAARLAALTGARPAPAQQRQPAQQQRPPASRFAPSGNGGTRLPPQYAEGAPFDPNEPMPGDNDIPF